MVRQWDRKRVGDAATTTRGAERRGAPPSRHTFSPGDKMGEYGGGREARIGTGGGHGGGGGMGSGPGRAEGWGKGWVLAFLVSVVRVRFSLLFFTGGWAPYYGGLGRSRVKETGI